MNRWNTTLAMLAALSASLAVADDFKTVNGKEYKNATVMREEPDGITIRFSGGVVKLRFSELPNEVQERFHYNPERARTYSSQSVAVQLPDQPFTEQQKHANAMLQARVANEQARQRSMQALSDRLVSLDKQERYLLAEIGRIQTAQENAYRRWVSSGFNSTVANTDPDEPKLPSLKSDLDNVRDEKARVRRELERAQQEPQ
ncbi:MAG TPA: hypothetical protein VFA51_01820 [Candidatus Udaeobacter sp.]|nr:hypothetical protein [Candidatus Udaeobacter sp.]